MIEAHLADDIRAAEDRVREQLRTAGQDEYALMELAAAGLAQAATDLLGRVHGTRVLVLAGSGDNGGDALLAGARLARRGAAVRYCVMSPRGPHRHGEAVCRAAGGRATDLAAARDACTSGQVDLVLDGVIGLGGRPGLAADVAELASLCRRHDLPVLAVDLPSGLAADQPGAETSFTAVRTVTFGTRRIAHLAQPAAGRCGRVEMVDLGLRLGTPALRQWEVEDLAATLPVPGPSDHKYTRGVVGLDTGSARYPGAALLGVLGAGHVGVGMVRYLGEAAGVVTTRVPHVVTAPGRVQALVIGSGWGEEVDQTARFRAAVAQVAEQSAALLLDADALTVLRRLHPAGDGDGLALPDPARLLLTPHAGELARLLGVERTAVDADPLSHVRAAAERYRATVLLKGSSQYVARPGETGVELALGGPAWTGQAGSGDVLAGICGALLAGGLPAHRAAAAGASLQALTATRHPGPWPPQELAAWLPEVVAELTRHRGVPGSVARRDGRTS